MLYIPGAVDHWHMTQVADEYRVMREVSQARFNADLRAAAMRRYQAMERQWHTRL